MGHDYQQLRKHHKREMFVTTVITFLLGFTLGFVTCLKVVVDKPQAEIFK